MSSAIRSVRNRDGGTILNIDRGLIFRTNTIGALILELLSNGRREVEIADEVAKQFEVSFETALADIHEFIQSLQNENLIKLRPEKPATT